MKRTVFCIFLTLNLPVFAEIDLPNQSKIPLRGSLGPNRKDAGNGRLSCSLVNETDRDWLVCVDESGEIVPKSVPEDARSSDIVEWTEIETFPNDVRWVYRLAPKPIGLAVDPDPWFLSWQIDEPDIFGGRFALPVRAIDWRRYVRTVAPTNAPPPAIDPANALRWGIAVHGSNLVLTVENPSDDPVLLHVGSNDPPERIDPGAKSGAFTIYGELRAPRPRLFMIQFVQVSASPRSGLYRVLHGQSAPSEPRTASFNLIGIDNEEWKPGDKLSCSLKLYPRIVSPVGKRTAVDEPFRSGEVTKRRKLKAKLVFGPDGWRVEGVP